MADGPITQLADLIVPEVFTPYVQQITEQKSRLIQSGAVVVDPLIQEKLSGGGLTFSIPSYKDLDDDDDNVATDAADDDFTGGSGNSAPKKIGSAKEIAVRLSRNQSWSSADLASDLIGDDPLDAIAQRVGSYWARRLQKAFISTMSGVFADNAAAPGGSEHVQDDMTNDISDVAYSAGVTDFSAAAFLDAAVTMGDSSDDLGLVFVHSIVENRMKKNNLIEYVEHSDAKVRIPTFLNRMVVVDDSMPNAGGVYQTWMFGAGAVRFGAAAPKVPTATARKEDSGNGSGSEILYNRVQWCLHPAGHRYAGTAADGGPSNAATANNLGHADSWLRVYPERKQIKIARLITRES